MPSNFSRHDTVRSHTTKLKKGFMSVATNCHHSPLHTGLSSLPGVNMNRLYNLSFCGNLAGKLWWVWREQCLGLDNGRGGQQGQSADGLEVVSWIAGVSTDYRKPDGSNSSAFSISRTWLQTQAFSAIWRLSNAEVRECDISLKRKAKLMQQAPRHEIMKSGIEPHWGLMILFMCNLNFW